METPDIQSIISPGNKIKNYKRVLISDIQLGMCLFSSHKMMRHTCIIRQKMGWLRMGKPAILIGDKDDLLIIYYAISASCVSERINIYCMNMIYINWHKTCQ